MNERPGICGPCGGKCCKALPGCCDPMDFGTYRMQIKANLTKALGSKKYAIDRWDGDIGPGYFIRPATVRGSWPFDYSWGGQCAMLTDTGCPLAYADRPKGCRRLEPSPPSCQSNYNKEEAKEAWRPYWGMIDDIARAIMNPQPTPGTSQAGQCS